MSGAKPPLAGAPCSAVRGVPEGCQEIPGFILDVFDGSAWITQDGQVTTEWSQRGIWPTVEAAEAAKQNCLLPNAPAQRPAQTTHDNDN